MGQQWLAVMLVVEVESDSHPIAGCTGGGLVRDFHGRKHNGSESFLIIVVEGLI